LAGNWTAVDGQLQKSRLENALNLGFEKQQKHKVQHFLIDLIPSSPSDLVMGLGGYWHF